MSDSSKSWVDDLPPAPKTMTEQEKKEQLERVRRAMFKILARMPIQDIIKARKDRIEGRGH